MRTLSVAEIESARIKVLENARELVEEAEILLSNERFARAYSLAHLASEEMAKIPMLVRAATDTLGGLEFNWAKLGRRLRNHAAKIKNILFVDFFHDPNTENDTDIKRLIEDLRRTPNYNKLKNWSLYTDLIHGAFLKPSEVISADLATAMVKVARGRLTFFEEAEAATQGNIEEIVKMPDFQAWLKERSELRPEE